MFKITRGTGFHMTFENGWTISVQFGTMNHCENRGKDEKNEEEYYQTPGLHCSSDAEIAIWGIGGDWYNFGDDEVKGHCSADEVATWIEFTKNQK